MKPKPTLEPLLWLMFSAGGVMAALFIPVLLLLFGVIFPLRPGIAPSHGYVLSVLSHPITRMVLFFLCTLALFHWAHRFRYTLYDGLQIKHLNEMINVVCYGGAIIGSIIAAYLLWQVP
jgi:fumarate reductase subunit D